VVLDAGSPDQPRAAESLETLCRTYWPPIYAYIRRRGQSPEDAQDLTQDFFAHLLSGQRLSRVGPQKGKFRTFLLASVNHLLADRWDRTHRQKRGGGAPVFSLDAQSMDPRYEPEPADPLTPEKVFERRWALTLLDQVLGRLEKEQADSGRSGTHAVLQPFLTGNPEPGEYTAAATTLGLTEGAVRVAIHRLRHRFGELFREEVLHTLSDPTELNGEMRHLLEVLSE
jgi:RNA polymerase sigma-70 factor (ECF subfamily)